MTRLWGIGVVGNAWWNTLPHHSTRDGTLSLTLTSFTMDTMQSGWVWKIGSIMHRNGRSPLLPLLLALTRHNLHFLFLFSGCLHHVGHRKLWETFLDGHTKKKSSQITGDRSLQKERFPSQVLPLFCPNFHCFSLPEHTQLFTPSSGLGWPMPHHRLGNGKPTADRPASLQGTSLA